MKYMTSLVLLKLNAFPVMLLPRGRKCCWKKTPTIESTSLGDCMAIYIVMSRSISACAALSASGDNFDAVFTSCQLWSPGVLKLLCNNRRVSLPNSSVFADVGHQGRESLQPFTVIKRLVALSRDVCSLE